MHVDVQEKLAHAKRLVEAGDHYLAAEYLSEALEEAKRPEDIASARAIAKEAVRKAGWRRRKLWKEILRSAERRQEEGLRPAPST